jgi:hypothetical protein
LNPRGIRMESGEGTTMKNFIAYTYVRVIKSRRLRWAVHVTRMEEGRSAFKSLTGTPAGKRPLGRPRRRWEDNVRMDLKEVGINTRSGLIPLRIGIIGGLF